jgi:hypothetical protein
MAGPILLMGVELTEPVGRAPAGLEGSEVLTPGTVREEAVAETAAEGRATVREGEAVGRAGLTANAEGDAALETGEATARGWAARAAEAVVGTAFTVGVTRPRDCTTEDADEERDIATAPTMTSSFLSNSMLENPIALKARVSVASSTSRRNAISMK